MKNETIGQNLIHSNKKKTSLNVFKMANFEYFVDRKFTKECYSSQSYCDY